MKQSDFVILDGSRRHWGSIAINWFALNDQYCHKEGDVVTWLNENSNVSLLASACWASGIPAVCEVPESRDYVKYSESGDEEKSPGRADMYLSVDADQCEYIEAKWINCSVFQEKMLCRQLELLEVARDEVATLSLDFKTLRTGIVFCSYYAKLERALEAHEKFHDTVSLLKRKAGNGWFYFWHEYDPVSFDNSWEYFPVGAIVIGCRKSAAKIHRSL